MSNLSSKLVFISLLSSATLFGALAIRQSRGYANGSTAQAAPTVNCTVPNNVSCNISSPKGIKSVKIQANTSLGIIDLVNKNYQNCPASVTVTWDSAYQSSNRQIVECSSVSGVGSGKPGKLKG